MALIFAKQQFLSLKGEIMKLTSIITLLVASLAAASASMADSVTLRNSDHLSGTIVTSDGKDVTLKTDYAGEIKISWSAVKEVSSDKALYVVTADNKTVTGVITTDGTNLIVHTAPSGEVQVPFAKITVVRSADLQAAYEKSLHPSLIEGWKGGVSIGLAIARGNSDTTSLSSGFTADRKTLNDELTIYESSIYTSNGGVNSGTTANSILGGIKYDRNFSKRLFGFVSGDFTHDELQGLDLRSIYSGGLGWHWINNPNTTLDLLGGINYTRETYSSSTTATTTGVSVNRNLPGITTGEVFMHKFGKSTVVTQDFYFYPDLSDIDQYRFSVDFASVTKINKWLAWQFSLNDRYVTDPPIVGTKTNDVILSTGLNVSFAH
jgi:putative salt-induced outer membrane protein